MDEYIKREAVEKAIDNVYTDLYPDYVPNSIAAFHECLLIDIGIIPAADVQPVDRWINARKNPPPIVDRRSMTSESVLILRDNGRCAVAYYCYDAKEGNYWTTDDDKTMYEWEEVTYWQPLPEPPKEDDAE